ncbi:Mariner Mos1 transposase [Anthophora quadrimaculata]
MEKIEYRVLIKFFGLNDSTPTEIHTELLKVLEDDPREGRPKTATTPQIIQQVHDTVLDDRRVKVRAIAEAIGISKQRIGNSLHEELHMKKLCARWVPHLLTIDQNRIRMRISQVCLDRFKQNKMDFKRRFTTIDKNWIHHYTPEQKEQSKQWIEASGSAPKKAKMVPSAGKVMATVFWNCKGVLLIDYLQKDKTINSEYYCNLLDQLDAKIREKRPALKKKRIIFHQNNGRAHTSVLAMAKFNELKYELLEHPVYSPDLAPSGYYLFPNLKKPLAGKRFTSTDEAIAAVNGYFADFPESYFNNGIELLEKRWNKCIEVSGNHIEK